MQYKNTICEHNAKTALNVFKSMQSEPVSVHYFGQLKFEVHLKH